ncbi:deoxyguanosinetriphosphate triphosphohydrolase family protein [Halanaerobacter jeridensis]|uniref:DGTPase n=1 Tax=Halanaerobacter jeridensis TaxID=706427 RepID=A0A938XXL8_9FIRM|nr:dNTP triphosphohydrolase [Halanaerobacter jeridensis]MBM7558146.1 dGTPase [Halanaerobacter jeridensis]
MIKRKDLEQKEKNDLKPYACFSYNAKRVDSVKQHPIRTKFQRDRDRIIHSKSFRRMEYKTQVYLTQTGDHLRTRLTHSLEVSQIARTIATQLGLNIDLVEAISLGHDVGHTPFGHVAERKLNKLLNEDNVGDFKHNIQSVRILNCLEKKYSYKGLRLTIPLLEGILKHTDKYANLPKFCEGLYLDKDFSVTLEGQVVAVADEIAQITHDMDDFLRYKIVSLNDFLDHELFENLQKYFIEKRNMNFTKKIENCNKDLMKETVIKHLVDYLVSKLIEDAEENLEDDIRAYEIDKEYIKLNKIEKLVNDFHKYINKKCFNDFRIKEMDRRGEKIVEVLYEYYKEYPKDTLPKSTYELYEENGIRTIADYISGMTDRYAIEEYDSLIELF